MWGNDTKQSEVKVQGSTRVWDMVRVWCKVRWEYVCRRSHYQLLHQTSFTYLMDRWLMHLIATFPFLGYLTYPCLHCTHYQSLHQTSFTYLMDRWLMDLIATFPFLVYPTCPIVAQLIMSHCAAQSGTYCHFISDEPCNWFLNYHLYLTHLYLPYHPFLKNRVFPRVQT